MLVEIYLFLAIFFQVVCEYFGKILYNHHQIIFQNVFDYNVYLFFLIYFHLHLLNNIHYRILFVVVYIFHCLESLLNQLLYVFYDWCNCWCLLILVFVFVILKLGFEDIYFLFLMLLLVHILILIIYLVFDVIF